MLSERCRTCEFCLWLVGLGGGVRCRNKKNEKYKERKGSLLPVIISAIPANCKFYTEKHKS